MQRDGLPVCQMTGRIKCKDEEKKKKKKFKYFKKKKKKKKKNPSESSDIIYLDVRLLKENFENESYVPCERAYYLLDVDIFAVGKCFHSV